MVSAVSSAASRGGDVASAAFRVLGPLEVRGEDGPVAVAAAKQRALLALLLLHANEPVSRDRLVEDLWAGRPPPTAGKTLQTYVLRLRKLLGDDRIVTTPGGYRIRVEAGELDLERFEALRRGGRAREALALWRGAPLPEFAHEGWAQAPIARLEELRLATVEDRIDDDIATGRHPEVVGELETLIGEHPLRERLRAQQMLALYRSGRQAEALDVYRRTRARLAEELGLEPGPELRRLEQAILSQDPSIAVPTPPSPGPPTPIGHVLPLLENDVIGREEERGTLAAFLEAKRTPAALAVEGSVGIGKSTVWSMGVALAIEQSYRVLACRPGEAETAFSFAALGDLLVPVLAEVRAEVPRLQRQALEAALLLEEREGVPPDAHVIALGLLSVLRVLERRQPLLLAIDDAQWLDRASAAALEFALRRLGEERLLVLLSVRREPGGAALALERALGERLGRLPVGPLSLGATHRLVASRLGHALPRPVLERLHATVGGNPFYALELARALIEQGQLEPGSELAIPASLEELVRARLESLPQAVRRVLEPAALLAEPTVALLEAVSDEPAELGDRLDEAVAAGLLAPARERLAFTHPLLAAATRSLIGPQRRRALHARLAELVGDAEQRARHLALATVEPDSVAAEQVEAGAVAAAARGAPPAAAELLELSARLTPADLPAEKARRLTAAAEQHVLAGASPRAQELLDGVLASAVRGPPRARAVLHFVLAKSGADLDVGLLNEALTEVGEDAALEAEILAQLASYAYAGNPLHVDEGERYGWASLEAAGRSGDPAVLARALASLSGILFNRGRGVPEELMERALALDPACDSVPIAQRPVTLFGWMWKWAGDLDRSRALLERARRIGEERGDATIADVLWFSSFLEFLAGDWPRGLTLADEVRELGVQSERAEVLLCADCANAVLYAHLGDEGKAREAASGASERAESLGFWHAAIIAGWGLGVLELSVGRPAKALEHAREASAFHRAGGVEEPSLNFSFPIHAEAAIAVGELDEAVELLDWIEERAVRLDREWALACIARCRGLLAAAGGDETTAVASFERALAEHARVQYRRFDRAHTLLAQGTTLRRFKKKRPAREALEKALAIFEELGARLWADRTRGELERIGGRTRSAGELTATERRVAELVAAGRTNKEVAAELFMTVRTVEWNLSKVYGKLDVRSRTQLTRQLQPNSEAFHVSSRAARS